MTARPTAHRPTGTTGRRSRRESDLPDRPHAQDLIDIVDIGLGTGVRIGELLAIRWQDIDLEAAQPTVTITGTLKTLKGKQSDGGGLVRQPYPKTGSSWRTLTLPMFAVATLLRLKVSAQSNEWDVVFTSARGTLRNPHNVRRQLRDARGETWAWVTPRTWRKTVATIVERESSLGAAAAQLGHAGEAITAKHYVQRASVAPDLTAVLDLLAPTSGAGQSN